jgi:hypothetical protein
MSTIILSLSLLVAWPAPPAPRSDPEPPLASPVGFWRWYQVPGYRLLILKKNGRFLFTPGTHGTENCPIYRGTWSLKKGRLIAVFTGVLLGTGWRKEHISYTFGRAGRAWRLQSSTDTEAAAGSVRLRPQVTD